MSTANTMMLGALALGACVACLDEGTRKAGEPDASLVGVPETADDGTAATDRSVDDESTDALPIAEQDAADDAEDIPVAMDDAEETDAPSPDESSTQGSAPEEDEADAGSVGPAESGEVEVDSPDGGMPEADALGDAPNEVQSDAGAGEAGVVEPALSADPLVWQESEQRVGTRWVEFASLMVPLDYAEPDAETIEIALARLRTNSPARRGTLLFNPGGPGATLVWDASYLLTQLSSIFENMDIVLMDNRGMGRSYPMQCIDVGQQPPVADPEDYSIEGQVAAGADYMTRLLESCDERFAERMTFFNTENVARDMEMLRLGLGEAQLHYWGVSYGTMQGALYAAMFPQGVGPWVLDSPVVRFEFGDPDMGDLFVESGREYETQLERFVAYCDASEQCGLSDGTAGGTGGALDQLQATLDDGVSYLDFDLPPYLLASFLETTLRWGDWDTIDLALSEALGGDWYSVLSTLFAEGGENEQDDQNSEVANLVINRTDYGCPANFTLDDAVAMATDVAEQFPRLGRWNGLRAGLCVPWNLARSEPAIIPAQVAAPPIVVMGALYDPATPYANAVALVEQLDNGSRLLTSDTEGHGVGTSSDCALNVLIDVVENGNVEAVPAVCGELTPQGLGAAPAARDAAEQLSRWMLDHDSRLGTPRVRL